MKISDFKIDFQSKPLMIAEEGQANQGDINIALQMAKFALESGADGIEYQLFFADDIYAKYHPGHKIYKSRELDKEEIKALLYETHRIGLLVQVTGFSAKIIDFVAKLGTDIFVVNATDLNNPEILDAIISTNKPFWLSALMAPLKEIDWAVEYALSKNAKNFGILHGQHILSAGFGITPENLQLGCIKLLESRYNLPVGFVDHTSTKIAAGLAIAAGARLVTKHLKPHNDWTGPDYFICLDPHDWKESKEIFDYSILSKGESKDLSLDELKDKSLAMRSIHTTRALKAGDKILRSDIICLRPGFNGINPSLIDNIIGKTLLVDINENIQIHPEQIKNGFKFKK
jgi:sialic acid synthase SpsE